jgi:hypothetical protein
VGLNRQYGVRLVGGSLRSVKEQAVSEWWQEVGVKRWEAELS